MPKTNAGTPIRFAVVATAFRSLRVAAALHCVVPGEHDWWPIHTVDGSNLIDFELEFGAEGARGEYNARNFAAVTANKRTILSELHGFSDLFVPVLRDGRVIATVVSGPFSTRRRTSDQILAQWRELSGRQGQLTDPAFAAYVRMSLECLTLGPSLLTKFQRLAEQLALIMAGEDPPIGDVVRLYELLAQVEVARDAERMWDAARAMVDERVPYAWRNAQRVYAMDQAGLSEEPDHVLAAVIGRDPPDPVAAHVALDGLQRRAVELAREVGNAVAGRVGDRGVSFIVRSGARGQRRKVLALSERAVRLARRQFGLELHFGVAPVAEDAPLWRSYQAALGAAEAALVRGVRIETADGIVRAPHDLPLLRRQLAADLELDPTLLAARFERYLSAVAAECGHAMDVARVHLEVGFDVVATALATRGVVDARSVSTLRASVEGGASRAGTLPELLAVHRAAIADLATTLKDPVSARHDHGMRVALEYVEHHFAKALSLNQVAKVAGYNVTYFSELFKKHEGVTFSAHLARLRLERARQLLVTTELSATRVAELSGFSSLSYFSRAFQRAFGHAPSEYRAKPSEGRRVARYWARRNLARAR